MKTKKAVSLLLIAAFVLCTVFSLCACEPDLVNRPDLITAVVPDMTAEEAQAVIDLVKQMNNNAVFSVVKCYEDDRDNYTYVLQISKGAQLINYYFSLNDDYTIKNMAYGDARTPYILNNLYVYDSARTLGLLGTSDVWNSLPEDFDTFVTENKTNIENFCYSNINTIENLAYKWYELTPEEKTSKEFYRRKIVGSTDNKSFSYDENYQLAEGETYDPNFFYQFIVVKYDELKDTRIYDEWQPISVWEERMQPEAFYGTHTEDVGLKLMQIMYEFCYNGELMFFKYYVTEFVI